MRRTAGSRKPNNADFWFCHGFSNKPCGYMVPRGKAWCDACGNQPPPHVSAIRVHGAAGGSVQDSAAKPAGDADQRVKQSEKKLRATEEKLKAVQKELEAAKAKPETATPGGPPPAAGPAGGGAADTSELDAAVLRARDKLKKLKDLPEEVREFVAGGFAECVAKLQGELDAAYAARRAANPLKKQLESAEAHKSRMEKKLADARAALLAREEELAEIQKRIQVQQAAVREAEASAAKASTEVAALVAQYASERTTAPAPEDMELGGAPQPQPPDGWVSVAFAEEKWAEREQEFTRQLAQLQALVAGGAEDGGQSEASPSEAGDVIPADQLEDDEAWRNIEPGKRRSVLRQERNALAKRVRINLGKVSSAASPFKKK